jgi:hypothetical protein
MLLQVSQEGHMQRLRAMFAAALSMSLMVVPVWGASTTALGTVIAADKAHVGQAAAGVGTTVFGGDWLSTEPQGSVQVRAGAARLLLLGASTAVVSDTDGAPSARLLSGTATFSTGNARAFTLFASKAVVRAATDAPTIGQVTYLNDKELLVTATRSGLIVSVEGETQVIPEGTSYRVLLDTEAQGPTGAGGRGGPPLKAGRSRFLLVTTVVTAAVTILFILEALESPERP